jgi:hypothetical protein
MTFLRIVMPLYLLFEHDLFGKPVPTFPDHALEKKRPQRGVRAEAVVHRTHWGLASGSTSTSYGGGNGSSLVTQLTSADMTTAL